MNILQELREFDGRHTNVLEDLASRYTPDARLLSALLKACESEDLRLQAGASWLLKRYLEQGATFTSKQSRRCCELIARVESWEPKIHLLQLLPRIRIGKGQEEALAEALRESVSHDNKLVRAWAYNGLFVLADQHEAYREEVEETLLSVSDDEAASVKARIRNIKKAARWF